MSQINQLKTIILATLAALGSTIAHALGGWDMTLQVLIGFITADYVTGLLVAGLFKNSGKTSGGALSSRAGFLGLVRKCATLLLVLLAALLDKATGNTFIRMAVCLFFIANEGLSILENLGLMGVRYPRFLRDMLEALRDGSDSGEGRP